MDLPPPRVCRGDGNLFIMLLVQPRSDARTQVHQTRPFQRPDRSLKADWLDERSTSNGADWHNEERSSGCGGTPPGTWLLSSARQPLPTGTPPPSPRDLQCCLKVRQVRHRAPPRYTKCACGRTLTDHRSHIARRDVPSLVTLCPVGGPGAAARSVALAPPPGSGSGQRAQRLVGWV